MTLKDRPGATCAVRRLGPGDVPAMRALNALFGRAFAEPDTYGAAPPDDAYLADLLAKAHVAVLVAEEGGAVIGGLVAYELDKFERARRELYIYDLAVEAAHRRRGIATALMSICRRMPRVAVPGSFSSRAIPAMARRSRSTSGSAPAKTSCISTCPSGRCPCHRARIPLKARPSRSLRPGAERTVPFTA